MSPPLCPPVTSPNHTHPPSLPLHPFCKAIVGPGSIGCLLIVFMSPSSEPPAPSALPCPDPPVPSSHPCPCTDLQAQEPAPAEGSEEAEEREMEKQHLDATLASCLCSLAEALLHKAQAAGEGGECGAGDKLAC